jgi:phage terminase large subunit-like protein
MAELVFEKLTTVAEASKESLIKELSPQELAFFYFKDHSAYKQEFFQNTVRQESPKFHKIIEDQLASGNRYNGFSVFRDGAKTTLLRIFASKRIAYGVSRTIVYVSNSSDNAERSIDWIKKQVEKNTKWASFYGLKPGRRWASNEIQIDHELLGITITMIAVGIRGQTRGINIEDYRPDLIIADDVDDEDTTNTPEQCRKYVKIFFGSIVRSLTPESENPHAMVCVLQTPLAEGDIISTCSRDPQWNVKQISCFSQNGESNWPARYPLETLKKDKEAMTARRLLSVWLREMEVTIASDEGKAFDANWLKFYESLPASFDAICIAIDPASADSDRADDNAIVMWGKSSGNYYLIAVSAETGQTHIDTSRILFEQFVPLARKLSNSVLLVGIETIGYQRNLKTQIEADQRNYGIFFVIQAIQDRRSKYDRILQAFSGNAFAGKVFCSKNDTKFIEQFTLYDRAIAHEDVLDASAIALTILDPYGTSFDKIVLGNAPRLLSNLPAIPSFYSSSRLFAPRALNYNE